MLRHPIYLAVCAFACIYLAVADAGGWSLLDTVALRMPSSWGGRGGGGIYGSFNHK